MKQIKGQLDLFEKRMAPVWHISLNHIWVECPRCKSYNTAQDYEIIHGKGFVVNKERCPECGLLFDWSDDAIEAVAKYSKDYPRD